MRLESLHIRRFKSLYDVELKFASFQVATGPNGAGKSNLVDAIAFMGEVYRFGLDYAVARAGGIDAIAFRDKRRTTTGVDFTVSAVIPLAEVRAPVRFRVKNFNPEEFELRLTHRFVLRSSQAQSGTDYYLGEEGLSIAVIWAGDESAILEYVLRPSGNASIQVYDRSDMSESVFNAAVWALNTLTRAETSEDLNEMVGSILLRDSTTIIQEFAPLAPVIRHFRTRMSYIRAYRLNPTACRKSAVLTPNATLETDGGNLPAVVAKVARTSDENWGRVIAGMRQLMPGLESIDTEPSPEYGLILRFHEAGRGRPWYAREVSDGIIQALALLLALYDDRPPFIAIEEPENAIHPWVIRQFIEHCRGVTDRQLLMTTHSPVVLSMTSPEELVLLWRRKGRSYLKPLTSVLRDSSKLYAEKGFDVFELYDSGLISEASPGSTDGVQE